MARPVKLDDPRSTSGSVRSTGGSGPATRSASRSSGPTSRRRSRSSCNVGFLAEAANHHPDIDIRWRTVNLALTTHDAGGLSDAGLRPRREDRRGSRRDLRRRARAAPRSCGIAVVVGVAKDPGPSPTDIALGYEHAWDELDFDVVYRLSGPELHDGLAKADWVAAKRAAYANGSNARPSRRRDRGRGRDVAGTTRRPS